MYITDCIWVEKKIIWRLSVYNFFTSKKDDCCNKDIEMTMEELEDGDKESLLMNMPTKTTVDSIIQSEIIHLSNQINTYWK